MSSVDRAQSQAAPNALYVNIANCSSFIFDETGVQATWANHLGLISSPGAVFRDMGKTLYLPSPTTPNAVAMQSTILRKVQFIPQGVKGYYGTGGEAGTVGTEFYTGYIPIGGLTYAGGGAAGTCVFARAN